MDNSAKNEEVFKVHRISWRSIQSTYLVKNNNITVIKALIFVSVFHSFILKDFNISISKCFKK